MTSWISTVLNMLPTKTSSLQVDPITFHQVNKYTSSFVATNIKLVTYALQITKYDKTMKDLC